jgi:hypothetical protein
MADHLTRRPRVFVRVHPESGSRSERVRSGVRAGLEGLEVSDGCGQDGIGSSGESDELADDLGHARLVERVGKGKSRACHLPFSDIRTAMTEDLPLFYLVLNHVPQPETP